MLKIISGGQIGVDRAALDVALQLQMPCGGFCPKGRKSEDGVIPEKYPLTETATDEYSERTALNVKSSDATLVIINRKADRGTSLTISLCQKYHKDHLVIDLSEEKWSIDVLKWIGQNKINILNIAGNRESYSPGISKTAFDFLLPVMKKVKEFK